MQLFDVKNNKLLVGKIPAEKLIAKYGSPLYVYDANIIRSKFGELKEAFTYKPTHIYYAAKTNTNLEILKLLRHEGSFVETVSQGEVMAALAAGYKPSQISYTCSNITADELAFVARHNILIHLDSLTQLEIFGKHKLGKKVSLRLNQGIGGGHHSHVITGGPDSKFGIDITQINEAKKIAAKYHLTIVGIHQHIGSGILNDELFMKAVKVLLETAKQFKNLEFIDFGGGFGIPYQPKEKLLDIARLGRNMSRLFEEFCINYGKKLTLKIEPGRYLVGQAGVLLTTVTDIKKTPYRKFVGVDSGFNHLIRPAMYGSYHEIVNASQARGKQEVVTIAGNICESGDVFAKDRRLTQSKIGDILAILNAGAYGYVMASQYNLRPRPAEVLVEGSASRLIRPREKLEF